MEVNERYLNSTMNHVRKILEEDPIARENDAYMTLKFLEEFKGVVIPPKMFSMALDNKINFETVRRARQKIQNKGECLPTNETVIKRRRLQGIMQLLLGKKN